MIKRLFSLLGLGLTAPCFAASLCSQPASFPASQAEILDFSKETTTALFTYQYDQMDTHLKDLKPCFSEQGWQSYQNALSASHTVETINKLKLTAKATLESQSVTRDENNLWHVSNLINVEYKNSTHFAKQKLKIEALIADADQELSLLQIKATELNISDEGDKNDDGARKANTENAQG